MFEENKEDKNWIDKWTDRIGDILWLVTITGTVIIILLLLSLGFYLCVKKFLGI